MIPALIDKQDNFEVVRDQIAAILALEIANQKVLAEAADKDPALWDFSVFSERSNPWERYLNDGPDMTPIVNVWYDGSAFDMKASNLTERQKCDAVYNIDIYGAGISSDDGAGQKSGDQEAALVAHRVIKLVRNILMAGEYTYLGLRGLVWGRWPQAIKIFQPELEGATVLQIVGARLTFGVTFNEFSPQVVAETLELLSTAVKRAEDGEVVVNADYNYPAP